MVASPVVLLTGFPTFGPRHLLKEILESEAETRVLCVVRPKFRADAQNYLNLLPMRFHERVELLTGDVAHVDFGLSGEEFRRITAEVTRIHHYAQVSYLGATRDMAMAVNVQGALEAIEVARHCQNLERLVHHSSACVSGTRRGVVLEDDLDTTQRFRNAVEESLALGEAHMKRAQAELPICILRPGVVVGDSSSGYVDRLDGPYYAILWLLSSPAEFGVKLPGNRTNRLHVVPIDYVTRAAHRLGTHPEAAGNTFHLTDPAPLLVREVFQLVAARTQALGLHRAFPAKISRALLQTPGLEDFARSPRRFLEQIATPVSYSTRNTNRLLAGSDLPCPSVAAYIDRLIEFSAEHLRQQQAGPSA